MCVKTIKNDYAQCGYGNINNDTRILVKRAAVKKKIKCQISLKDKDLGTLDKRWLRLDEFLE